MRHLHPSITACWAALSMSLAPGCLAVAQQPSSSFSQAQQRVKALYGQVSERGEFETQEEFAVRAARVRGQLNEALAGVYLESVTITLGEYNIDTETFSIQTCFATAERPCPGRFLQEYERDFHLRLPRDEARLVREWAGAAWKATDGWVGLSPDGTPVITAIQFKVGENTYVVENKQAVIATGSTAWETSVEAPAYNIALSPTGTLLAISTPGTVVLLDRVAKQEIASFSAPLLTHAGRRSSQNAHLGVVQGLSFAPDGHEIAVLEDNRISRWQVDTHERLPSIEGHFTAMAYSLDGKSLLTAANEELMLWNNIRQEPNIAQRFVMGISDLGPITSVGFFSDGQSVWSAGRGESRRDPIVKGWDPRGVERWAVHGFSALPDGRHFTRWSNSAFSIHKIATGRKLLSLFSGPESWASSSNGEIIAATGGAWVQLYALDSEATRTRVVTTLARKPFDERDPMFVTFSQDGKTLAHAAYDGTVTVWDLIYRKTPWR